MIGQNSAEQPRVPLQRRELAKIKEKALRRGIWFKTLTRTERALVDLTVRVVARVQGFLLAKMLESIMTKLLDAMEGVVSRMMKTVGQSLAEELCQIARAWGNKSASKWGQDQRFIRYLTVTYINTPAMFKS